MGKVRVTIGWGVRLGNNYWHELLASQSVAVRKIGFVRSFSFYVYLRISTFILTFLNEI